VRKYEKALRYIDQGGFLGEDRVQVALLPPSLPPLNPRSPLKSHPLIYSPSSYHTAAHSRVQAMHSSLCVGLFGEDRRRPPTLVSLRHPLLPTRNSRAIATRSSGFSAPMPLCHGWLRRRPTTTQRHGHPLA
jgi:hypothetical protein